MTPNTPAPRPVPTEPITLDDIKRRAQGVREMAVRDSKRAVHEVVEDSAVRTIVAVGLLVILTASITFYVVSRNNSCPPPLEP